MSLFCLEWGRVPKPKVFIVFWHRKSVFLYIAVHNASCSRIGRVLRVMGPHLESQSIPVSTPQSEVSLQDTRHVT